MIFAAIDWGEQWHHLVILDADGVQLESRKFEHHHNGLHELDAILTRHAKPEEVHLAVELHAGVLVDWLLQRSYRLYGINPKSAERARERFTPAGLKDDERDAWSLAEFLRTSHQHLRPLQRDSEQTLALQSWVRLRESFIQERTVQLQRLRSHLVQWHPHALKTIKDLNRDWALDLLHRVPTAERFAALTFGKVEQWAKGRRLRAITLDRIGTAVQYPSPATCAARNQAHAATVRYRVKAIRQLNVEIKKLDERLTALVADHPDAVYFNSLPVHGTVTVATFLAGFGEDRDRWNGCEEVAARWGVAPVTQQSGKHKSVKRRMARDTTIHQAWLWFAFNTITRDGCWAREYYRDKRRAGTNHYTALRCTAQRWVKITYRLWYDRIAYDEHYHQARQKERMEPKLRK